MEAKRSKVKEASELIRMIITKKRGNMFGWHVQDIGLPSSDEIWIFNFHNTFYELGGILHRPTTEFTSERENGLVDNDIFLKLNATRSKR